MHPIHPRLSCGSDDNLNLIGTGSYPGVATVTNVEYLDEDEDMYDLNVEDDHSYLLGNGIMSHNSLMAIQVALHQALLGARICIVSLEMTREETIRRILSNLTAIPLSQINRAHELDNATRRLLMKAWLDYNTRVRNNGGRLTIISPDEDVTLEDVLTLLKPYNYDNIVIDYLGLLKGMDGEDQWRRLGAGARYAKRYAGANKNIVTLLAQLSTEGIIKYSRAIMEHASLMWQWSYTDEAVRESRIITVKMPKARNLKAFDFSLVEKFPIMRIEDMDPSMVTNLAEERRKRKRASQSEEVSPRARAAGRKVAGGGSRDVYQL